MSIRTWQNLLDVESGGVDRESDCLVCLTSDTPKTLEGCYVEAWVFGMMLVLPLITCVANDSHLQFVTKQLTRGSGKIYGMMTVKGIARRSYPSFGTIYNTITSLGCAGLRVALQT